MVMKFDAKGTGQLKMPSAGSAGSLPLPTYEVETVAFTSAQTTLMTSRRLFHFNRMVKRLKATGVWAKGTALYLAGADEQTWMLNVLNPFGPYNLTKVGTPTFVANDAVTFSAATSYYSTNIPLNSLSASNLSLGIYTDVVDASSSAAFGATDGTSFANAANGVSLAPNGNTHLMSAALTGVSGNGVFSGNEWVFANATSATTADVTHNTNGVTATTNVTKTNPTITSTIPITIGKANNTGTTTATASAIRAVWIGQTLTPVQRQELYGAVRTYVETIKQGEPIFTDIGVGPSSINYDYVCYGLTAASIISAYELSRLGKSVCLVGGYRDTPQTLGGMNSNGLASFDWFTRTAMGGLGRSTISRCQVIKNGTTSTSTLNFVPRNYLQVMREMLDSRHTTTEVGVGYDIPIFLSGGVNGAMVSSGTLLSFTTTDGRTVNVNKDWFDGSYECDLLYYAGVPFTTGREAAAYYAETGSAAGFISPSSTTTQQFLSSATGWNVDPFNTMGDSTSGLLPSLTPYNGSPATGAGDSRTQDFNYRLTWTATASQKAAFSSSQPANFNAALYEPLLRWMALDPNIGVGDLYSLGGYGTVFDINNANAFSTDCWGSGTDYTKAGSNYVAREAVIQRVQQWGKGLVWLTAFGTDPRIPSAVKTTMATYAWGNDHYLDPYRIYNADGSIVYSDDMFFPGQIYVREMRRALNVNVLNSHDAAAVDGTTLRISTNIIASGSYAMDSHQNQALADLTHAPPRIWREGQMYVGAGGTDGIIPVNYELVRGDKGISNNGGWTSFGGSSSHLAMGCIRLEGVSMQVGQSIANAMVLKASSGVASLAEVSASALRTQLLARPDALALTLQQVN